MRNGRSIANYVGSNEIEIINSKQPINQYHSIEL